MRLESNVTFALEFFVLGEDVKSKGMVAEPKNQQRSSRMQQNGKLYRSLTNLIASSRFSTGTTGNKGPKISLKCPISYLFYTIKKEKKKKKKTNSLIKESPGPTSLTTVGAIYLFSLSISPPNTIVPWVLSRRPATRAVAWGVTMRLKAPGAAERLSGSG
jgi:hypothetical protein